MHVISFLEHLNFDNSPLGMENRVFEANKPYLFADKQFQKLRECEAPIPFEKISKAEPMLLPFHFSLEKPQGSVLIYNGVGGMGDQMMTWPLAKILADRGYEVHILTDPHLVPFWQGFPWIHSILTLPCYWSFINRFDAFINAEYISNGYAHEGQMQPIDVMLRMTGIDPESIPDEEKVVTPTFTRIEMDITNNIYQNRSLAFYQLAASQKVRSLSPEHSRAVLKALAEEFPDFYWIAVYGPLEASAYWEGDLAENVEFRSFERPRLVWSLMTRAELCVGPDSMLVHAAGSLGKPCIGLWGPYGPKTRVRYYKNHYPIHHTSVCPLSPCHWNAVQTPHICPPSQTPRERCEVMLQITPEEVIEGAHTLLSQQPIEAEVQPS